MFHRRPLVINQLEGKNFTSLAQLSGLEGLSRAMLVGIIPLVVYDALGSKSAVSTAYFGAACITVLITLNLASLERLLHRRWVLTLSGVFLVAAALLMWLTTGFGVVAGIGLRASAASMFTVCLSLYVMDYIDKRQFAHAESRRMVYNGSAWLIGPFAGAWLWAQGLNAVPFLLSMAAAAAMVAYFWILRLGSNEVLQPATSRVISPIRAVPRYFSQKRLRIAYMICVTRSSFWVALYVYGPIYVIEAGLPTWMGGALLSGVSGLLFFSPTISRYANEFGTRAVIICGLSVCGIGLLGLGLLGEATPVGLVFWVLASVGAIALDVLGNIPFMRSVKPRERAAMTVVFSTWREGSELFTPGIIALILLVAPFWAFYFFLAACMLSAALMATHLPKRM